MNVFRMAFRGSLYCIHGFLGLTSDWNTVVPSGINCEKISLFSPQTHFITKFGTLRDIGNWINQETRQAPHPRVLLGYSLGGRIALHALLANPEQWAAAIFISTHFGLKDLNERKVRIESDQNWAEKFESSNWEKTIHEWNSQKVFQGDNNEPERPQAFFSRKALGHALRNFSLGNQESLKDDLKRIKKPILWIVGENDSKFKQLSEQIGALSEVTPSQCTGSDIRIQVIPQSGHRILFDQPAILKQRIEDFLSQLESSFYSSDKTRLNRE